MSAFSAQTAMAEGAAPNLPLDLERHIFELAALTRPVCIPKLMRVAWRVKHWVEPLLYRTLFISHNPIAGIPRCDRELLTTPIAENLLHSVRNVQVKALIPEYINTVISACPHIENLYLMTSVALNKFQYRGPGGLMLKHLYCPEDFFVAAVKQIGTAGFSQLTHLELFGTRHRAGESAEDHVARWTTMLGDLPELMHLALPTMSPSGIYSTVLLVCRSLRALLVLDLQPSYFPRWMPWQATLAS
ncbi:hypothetical protein DFH06DRAFT_1325161 [Mycena polygramma]|nr:hypothetical protein DFH06DRAFT_1325161 [Mycena polygramma]